MIRVAFSFIKGGTGKTVLASSSVLYMAAVLSYLPVVARAYARKIPLVLARSPKASRHGGWRRRLFKLMAEVEKILKKEVRR